MDDTGATWHLTQVIETGSTNADLLAAAARGAPDRSVLRAEHQSAGRGRLDRRWEAPPGANLLASLLFRRVPTPAVELTWRVGLAACVACEVVSGVAPTLKWPNDLLVGDGKLAGILAESGGRNVDGGIDHVVVGIGLNVGWAPVGAARLGGAATPKVVLGALLDAYDGLPIDIGDLYRQRLATLGRAVQVEIPDGSTVEGTAIDVDPDGRLVVLDGCGMTHRFDVGDVVHARRIAPGGGGYL